LLTIAPARPEFAETIGAELDTCGPPDLETLGRCFAPHPTAIPDI
jgi:hypothetical protein